MSGDDPERLPLTTQPDCPITTARRAGGHPVCSSSLCFVTCLSTSPTSGQKSSPWCPWLRFYESAGAGPCRQANGSHAPSGRAIKHDPPLVFNVTADPAESTPVFPAREVYEAISRARNSTLAGEQSHTSASAGQSALVVTGFRTRLLRGAAPLPPLMTSAVHSFGSWIALTP